MKLPYLQTTKIFGDYNESSHLVELNKISEWMKNNKLTLNEAKTQFMLVGKKAEQSDYFTWNNAEIQAKTVVKYLGVLIDYRLDFREHVNFIEKQCAKFITILYQTCQFLEKNLLVKILKQYVQPRYQYGILIYGTTAKSILTKLQRQQFSQNSLSIKEIGRGSHKKKARNSLNF